MTENEITNNICAVCGDRANGFNFNVLSCESCKAFFRRNASKNTELKCIFNGKCDIDKKNRKLCRCCRLNKCFTTGMKKEWILSEEQKKVRKNVKQNKRNRKKLKNYYENNTTNYSKNYQSFDLLVYGNNDMKRDIFYDVLEFCNSSPEEISKENDFMDMFLEDITQTSIESDSSLVCIPRPITDYKNNLTEIEGNYLTELLRATDILKIPFGAITSEATTFIDALHVLISARSSDAQRYVSMSKNLIGFKNICRNDKFSLLKPGLVEMFFMRNVVGYFNDNNTEYFIVPTDSEKSSTCLIKFDLFRQTKPYLYEAKRDFYQKISREWDSDHIILDLLTAIILFNPDRRRIIEPQTIRLQQHIYKYLLQRYLQLKYRTESEAKSKYSRLLKTIDYLHVLLRKNCQNIREENFLEKRRCHSLLEELGV